MTHRNNIWRDRLGEHLAEREWSPEDKEHFEHMVTHSTVVSYQGALAILEFQRSTDERIEAEKEHDKWTGADIPIIERPEAGQLVHSIFSPYTAQCHF